MAFRALMVVLAVVAYVDSQITYDCRRTGTPCQGTCLINGANAGQCLCPAGRTKYDCSLTGTLQTAITCTNPLCDLASGRQICYSNVVGVHLCDCTAGYTGPNCDIPRVQTQCYTDRMEVSINPLPGANFGGKIFVKGSPACEFPQPTSPSTTFVDTLSLNSCGISPVTDGSGNTRYSVVVTVQYSPFFQTQHDQEHIATCIHAIDGTVTGTVGVQAGGSRSGVNVSDTAIITHLEIMDSSGNLLTNANTVIVGDDLDLRIVLDSNQYASHFTSRCSAYNDSALNPRLEKKLVENGCVLAPAAYDVVRPPMTRVGDVITLPIDAFKFDTSDMIYFECDVHVCRTAGDPNCAQRACGTAGNGFGRKKRQAENEGEIQILTGGFRVLSRGDMEIFDCPTSTNQYTQESCVQSVPFLVVTAVFGALLLVALAASGFLCFRFSRRERRHVGKKAEPIPFSNPAMSKA